MTKGPIESLLERPTKFIEAPKPPPRGEYHMMVVGLPREDKSQKGTPYYEFTFKFLAALKSVNEDDLDAWLGDKAITDKTLTGPPARYYRTEESAWRLVKLLDNLEAGDNEMSLPQRIAETPNKEIILSLTHDPRGEDIFVKIKSNAKVSTYEEPDDE